MYIERQHEVIEAGQRGSAHNEPNSILIVSLSQPVERAAVLDNIIQYC